MRKVLGLTLGCLLAAVVSGCGGGRDSGGPSCVPFAACGGDLTGTWSIERFCGDLPQGEDLVPGCPEASASGVYDLSGTLAFEGSGTYSVDAMLMVDAEVTVPGSCLPDTISSCSDLDSTDAGTTCTGDLETACVCSVATTETTAMGGTWSTSGTTATTTDSDGDATDLEYCVDGGVLRVETPEGVWAASRVD